MIRLDQPGIYDELLAKSLRRSREEGRRVAMTEIARDAIAKDVKGER